MRFTVAAAILATGAMAAYVPPVEVSTDFETKLVTITSCGPEVTNCPARSSSTPYSAPAVETTSEALPVTTSAPLTTSTIYATKVHTITSCGAEVTNCPARSTVVSTETIAVSTTICPVVEESVSTKTPVKTGGENSPVKPSSVVPVVPVYTSVPSNGTYGGGSSSGHGSSYVIPQPPTTPSAVTQAQCVPSSSVTAITKSYTTVYTSVEYSTIQIPCSASNTAAVPPAVSTPVGGGQNSGHNNTVPASTPTASSPPQVTGAAGAITGSAFFAAAAGLAALVLA